MKIKLTIEDMFNLESSTIYNPDNFKPTGYVTINSKTVKKNSIFVAIKGKKFDGHNFVEEAFDNGAATAIINRKKLNKYDNINKTIVTVKNTLVAYGELAKFWRNKLNVKVISISGSNGKTTTKEMLYTLLSEKYKVQKTRMNNNNQIGVPLTIFETNSNHQILILEHGTNHFGEIEFTAKIAEPDYGLLTNIGDSHLEYLKDRKGVLREKQALLDETKNNNGTVFINFDDPLLKKTANNYKNLVTFGFKGNPDIKGEIKGFTKDAKAKLLVISKSKKIDVELPVYGRSNTKNYLAAVAIAIKLGLTKNEIINGTKKIKPVKGRLNHFTLKNISLIDDTYNSNPQSLNEALEVLRLYEKYNTKIAILGDMFELGNETINMHRNIAKVIKQKNIDYVFTIGKLMKHLDENLQDSKISHKHFRTRNSLKKFINKSKFDNAVVLIKGSRGMKMEEFAELVKGKYN